MKVIDFTRASNFNTNHRKERHFYRSYTACAIIDGKIIELVDLRLYATNSRHYACVWIKEKAAHSSGTGFSSGYGYHRASAAAGIALEQAGVKLSESISGRGETAIENALKAIVEYLTENNYVHIVIAHS